MNGAVLIKGDGGFKISSSADVSEGEMGSVDYPGRSGRTADGYGVYDQLARSRGQAFAARCGKSRDRSPGAAAC